MSKQSQVLQIDPHSELVFKGPFTDVITTNLQLSNPSPKSVCFKVKTTAPKQYCVRPNSGIIPPNSAVQVAVMLQPFDASTDTLERAKHKFMVQSVFVAEGEQSLDNIWKNTPASEFMESKLRVVFDHPEMNDSEKSSKMSMSTTKTSAASTDADIRRQLDDNKRTQHRLQTEEKENLNLREQIRILEGKPPRPQAIPGTLPSSGDDPALLKNQPEIKLLYVIASAIVALLVGIILGKMLFN